MLYCRARYYNPFWGRFISADPAGSGINPYVYAGNNPVNATDPTGLQTDPGAMVNQFTPSHEGGTLPNEGQTVFSGVDYGQVAQHNENLVVPMEAGGGDALAAPETSAASGGYTLTTEPVGTPLPAPVGTGGTDSGPYGGLTGTVNPDGSVTTYGSSASGGGGQLDLPFDDLPPVDDAPPADDPLRKHHITPQYLGGDEDGPLGKWPESVHVRFHLELDKVFPRNARPSGMFKDIDPDLRDEILRELYNHYPPFQ